MPSLLGKKMPSLLGNVGLAVVLAAAQDQEWQGAGWVLAPVPFPMLLEGQSRGGQGAWWDSWGRGGSIMSCFDNCIISQCVWGGVLSYNCLGQAGAKSLWGLVLGPGLCVGAGVADDYM